jgi:hypothetical protein
MEKQSPGIIGLNWRQGVVLLHSADVIVKVQELLQEVHENLVLLASNSEFEQKRRLYMEMSIEARKMEDNLQKELDNVADFETYTGILDKI